MATFPRGIGRALLHAVVAVLAVLPAARGADEQPRKLFARFCGDCHFDGAAEAGVAIDKLLAATSPGRTVKPTAAEHAAWVNLWRNLRAETMPPADEPQPSAAERRRLLEFVSRDVLGVEPTRLGYGPHRIFVWAHNQEPIFSRGIGRRMRERVQLEEVGR